LLLFFLIKNLLEIIANNSSRNIFITKDGPAPKDGPVPKILVQNAVMFKKMRKKMLA